LIEWLGCLYFHKLYRIIINGKNWYIMSQSNTGLSSFELHRKKMQWVFREIRDPYFCDVCGKYIFRHIWSVRGEYDMVCCSSECVDAYDFWIHHKPRYYDDDYNRIYYDDDDE